MVNMLHSSDVFRLRISGKMEVAKRHHGMDVGFEGSKKGASYYPPLLSGISHLDH